MVLIKGVDIMKIQKIMVAYDASPSSEKALKWAIQLALQLESEIEIITVVTPPEFRADIDEIDERYSDGDRYYIPALKESQIQSENAGIQKVSYKILHEHPSKSIVQYASNGKFDLIVMGTRGMGGFKQLIIGSVAQGVMTYADVPVTIIK